MLAIQQFHVERGEQRTLQKGEGQGWQLSGYAATASCMKGTQALIPKHRRQTQ